MSTGTHGWKRCLEMGTGRGGPWWLLTHWPEGQTQRSPFRQVSSPGVILLSQNVLPEPLTALSRASVWPQRLPALHETHISHLQRGNLPAGSFWLLATLSRFPERFSHLPIPPHKTTMISSSSNWNSHHLPILHLKQPSSPHPPPETTIISPSSTWNNHHRPNLHIKQPSSPHPPPETAITSPSSTWNSHHLPSSHPTPHVPPGLASSVQDSSSRATNLYFPATLWRTAHFTQSGMKKKSWTISSNFGNTSTPPSCWSTWSSPCYLWFSAFLSPHPSLCFVVLAIPLLSHFTTVRRYVSVEASTGL